MWLSVRVMSYGAEGAFVAEYRCGPSCTWGRRSSSLRGSRRGKSEFPSFLFGDSGKPNNVALAWRRLLPAVVMVLLQYYLLSLLIDRYSQQHLCQVRFIIFSSADLDIFQTNFPRISLPRGLNAG